MILATTRYKKQSWTKDDLEYLEEKWGIINSQKIAENLGRSPDAVAAKARRLGYSNFKLSQDGITIGELSNVLQVDYKKIRRWMKKYKFPSFVIKVTQKQRIKMINIDSFWKWAKSYSHLIDFTLLEENALGAEPSWVKKERQSDYLLVSQKRQTNKQWSKQEERQLVSYVNEFKYSYEEISKLVTRSEKVIAHKLIELGVKARPLKANPKKWELNETVKLMGMMNEDIVIKEMANEFGRSETAISGKIRKLKSKRGSQAYCMECLYRSFMK